MVPCRWMSPRLPWVPLGRLCHGDVWHFLRLHWDQMFGQVSVRKRRTRQFSVTMGGSYQFLETGGGAYQFSWHLDRLNNSDSNRGSLILVDSRRGLSIPVTLKRLNNTSDSSRGSLILCGIGSGLPILVTLKRLNNTSDSSRGSLILCDSGRGL